MQILHKARSIRFVLTLWYSIILLIAFVLFGSAVYLYLKHLQETSLQEDLLEEVDWIARIVDVERSRVSDRAALEELSSDIERRITEHFMFNPRNYIVMLTSSSGNILYESDNRQNRDLVGESVLAGATLVYTVRDSDGTVMRVAARRDAPFVIEVAYTERVTQAVLERLLSIFAVLAPVVLFVAISGGWLMAGIVLRPIREISERAKEITASNLSGRIITRSTDDELGELISTINSMISRLEMSFRNIREFSLSIAHELKTPLTILKGESELALTRPLSPLEAEQLASTYLEETSRLSRIVDDLLTLAKVEAGQMTLSEEPVKLHELVDGIYEDALILAADRQIAVTLDRNDRGIVTGDPVRLRQLLRALISNAVRYTDPGGTVRIQNERNGDRVSISIEDTGIGIPIESLDKIFDRFYRVDEARSRVYGGSGLGLSIAKWIAEAHHGSISVRSSSGKGSCFTVHLPLNSPQMLKSHLL
ncbi:MAG TPA: ATP-binding protein [Bacteroidota bacterium]